MPTYEYACPKCGIIEFFQSIKDEPLAKCPQCKRAKVTRLFSGGAGVIFKGSGFWETDYNRSSDYQSKAKAEAGNAGADPNSKPKAQTQMKKSDGGGAATATATVPASGGTKPTSGETKPTSGQVTKP